MGYPKLTKIFVDGYKNLIDCQAELHDFNVLVGPNNSGKSNFLEIFHFARGLLFGSDEYREGVLSSARTERGDFVCHLEGHVCKPTTVVFTILDKIDDAEQDIKYSLSVQCANSLVQLANQEIQVGFISEELSIKNKAKTGKPTVLLKRSGDSFKVRTKSGNFSKHNISLKSSALPAVQVMYPKFEGLDVGFIGSFISLVRMLFASVHAISPEQIRANIGKGTAKPFAQYRSTSIDLIQAVGKIKTDELLFSQFKSVLCQVLDLEDVRFTTFKVPPDLRKDSKELPEEVQFFELKLPHQPFTFINNFSDGTLVVTAIVAVVLTPDNQSKLLCIEEPENCLHPKALKTLISYLIQKSRDVQIIITTHSPYLLNFISPEDVLAAHVFDDGATRFERIKNIKELNRRLSKGYISFGDLLETEFREDEEVAI